MINFIESCKIAYSKIPDQLFQKIKEEVKIVINLREDISSIPFDTLRGSLLIENHIPKNFIDLEKFVIEIINAHNNRFDYFDRMFNSMADIGDKFPRLKCEKIWFNIQRPGGYFPLHQHNGVYSFVLWIDIPYTIDLSKTEYSKDRSGMFEFVYIDFLGKITTELIPVDKSWEGILAVFPAELHHQVYPFQSNNSNDLRIAVAGDVFVTKDNFIND